VSEVEGEETRAYDGGAPRAVLSSLRIRNFRLFFIGQCISGAGSWMQNVAIGWLALQSFHSGAVLGAVTAVRYSPVVLLGLVGGLVADRVDSRKLLIVTQLCAAALSLALAFVSSRGHVQLGVLMCLVVLVGLVDVADVPGRQSILGQLVDRNHLNNSVALLAIASNSARSAGPAFAGALIAGVGVAPCFLINAFSFLAVLVSIVRMDGAQIRPMRREAAGPGLVRAGLRYARRTPTVWAAIVMVAVTGTLTWEFPVSLPLITTRSFHGNAAAFGLAMSCLGIGSIVGGVIAARRRAPTVRSLAIAAVMWGVLVLIAAAAPTLLAEYVVLVFVGLTAITFNASAKSILQIESAPEMRGRVMSLWYLAWQGTTLVGAPIVGLIGNSFGARYGLALGGAAAAVVGLVYLRARAQVGATTALDDVIVSFAEE
jgi:MFS family permease